MKKRLWITKYAGVLISSRIRDTPFYTFNMFHATFSFLISEIWFFESITLWKMRFGHSVIPKSRTESRKSQNDLKQKNRELYSQHISFFGIKWGSKWKEQLGCHLAFFWHYLPEMKWFEYQIKSTVLSLQKWQYFMKFLNLLSYFSNFL